MKRIEVKDVIMFLIYLFVQAFLILAVVRGDVTPTDIALTLFGL